MVAHSADAPSGLDLHEGDGAVLLQLGDGGPTKSCWGKMIDALPHLQARRRLCSPHAEKKPPEGYGQDVVARLKWPETKIAKFRYCVEEVIHKIGVKEYLTLPAARVDFFSI